MYLFENYMGKTCLIDVPEPDLLIELEQAGFDSDEIHNALKWLDGLDNLQKTCDRLRPCGQAIRIFAKPEKEKLGVAGCGFIYFLENVGVLNPITRELVVDRALALDEGEIELSRLKWVTLMVLFSSGDKEAELAWLEDFVLNSNKGGLQ